MQLFLALAALAAAVTAQEDGRPSDLFDRKPDEIADCEATLESPFTIQRVNVTTMSEKMFKRQTTVCPTEKGSLIATLTEGDLVDQDGFTGSIVANQQFQFDGPSGGPQVDAIFTTGFRVCSDNKLYIGENSTFYSCYNNPTPTKEGFGNIYNVIPLGRDDCQPIYFKVNRCEDTEGVAKNNTQQIGREGYKPSLSSSSSAPSSTESAISASGSMTSDTISDTTAPTVVPVSNTTVAATGTGAGSPTGPTTAPSPFTGAGSVIAACQGFVIMVAGAAAFALV